jgi:hypothetical protein
MAQVGLAMTQPRRVFGDLTNTVAKCSLESGIYQGGDPSKIQPIDCSVYKSDFCILEDVPYQEIHGANRGYCKDSLVSDLPQASESFVDSSSDSDSVAELVARCAADLCDLWKHSARSGGSRIPCLLQRFSAVGPPQLAAVFCSPPASTPPPPSQVAVCRKLEGREGKSKDVRETCDIWHACPEDDADLPTIKSTLTNLSRCDDVEKKADSCFQDLCNIVLRSSQVESNKFTPSAVSILSNIRAEDREATLLWLFQVCATIDIQDSVLYLSVLLLDRFCASLVSPIPMDRLQIVTVAIISISLKVNGAVDENANSAKMQDLLPHLGQHRFTLPQINLAAHEVLRRLDYSVTMPSAVDFLDTLLLPHCSLGNTRVSPVWCLAKFVLQLSLLDVPLHYRYPHSVLAAGAVHLALWCTRADPEHASALLADVARCCSQDDVKEQLSVSKGRTRLDPHCSSVLMAVAGAGA